MYPGVCLQPSQGRVASPSLLSESHVSGFHRRTLNLNHVGKSILENEFAACPLPSLEKSTFEGGSGDAYLIKDNLIQTHRPNTLNRI